MILKKQRHGKTRLCVGVCLSAEATTEEEVMLIGERVAKNEGSRNVSKESQANGGVGRHWLRGL